jgi:hypothetical protein
LLRLFSKGAHPLAPSQAADRKPCLS